MDTTKITKKGRLFVGLFLLVILGFACQAQGVKHLNTGSMIGKKMSTQSSIQRAGESNHGARKSLFGQLEARQIDKSQLMQLKQEDAAISVSQGETPSIISDSTQSLDAGVVIPVSVDAPVISKSEEVPYTSVSTSAEAPIEVTASTTEAPTTSSTDTTALKADNLAVEEVQDNSEYSSITSLIPETVIESAANEVLKNTGTIKSQILQNHKGLKDMYDQYNEDQIFGNAVDLEAVYQDNLDKQIQEKLGKKPGSLSTALPLANLFDKIEKEGFGLHSGHLDPLFINGPSSDDDFDYIEEEVEVDDQNSGKATQEPPKVEENKPS